MERQPQALTVITNSSPGWLPEALTDCKLTRPIRLAILHTAYTLHSIPLVLCPMPTAAYLRNSAKSPITNLGFLSLTVQMAKNANVGSHGMFTKDLLLTCIWDRSSSIDMTTMQSQVRCYLHCEYSVLFVCKIRSYQIR